MRTVDIEIGGVTYPLCLTLDAYSQICDRYGDMQSCMMRLQEVAGQYELDEKTGEPVEIVPMDREAMFQEYTWLLSVLLLGGYRRRQNIGDGQAVPPLAHAALLNTLMPGDMPDVQRKVLEAITVAQRREVDAQPPKNGGGAGGGQGPEN